MFFALPVSVMDAEYYQGEVPTASFRLLDEAALYARARLAGMFECSKNFDAREVNQLCTDDKLGVSIRYLRRLHRPS